MTNYSSYPGVRKISFARCSQLPPLLMLAAIAGDIPLVGGIFQPIKTFGTPVLKTEYSMVCNGRTAKASLQFDSLFRLPVGEHLAFLVECVNGRNVLIGFRERPYPVVNYSETSGKTDGDPALISYEINHTARATAIDILL